MDSLVTAAFVFLCGITVAGLSAALMELASGQVVRLGEPFVSPRRPARAVLLTALAGPMMLANELLADLRDGAARPMAALARLMICLLWVMASGVLVAEAGFRAIAALS